MIKSIAGLLALSGFTAAHGNHAQSPIAAGPHQGLWYNTLPGDGGTQVSLLLFTSRETLLTIVSLKLRLTPSFPEFPHLGDYLITHASPAKPKAMTLLF